MNISNLARVWVLAVLPLVTLVLAIISYALLATKTSDNQEILRLSQLNLELRYSLEEANYKNKKLSQDLKMVAAQLEEKSDKLNRALVPQATVTAAFNEQIAKPVVSITSKMWTDVKTSSQSAWNYVFN